MTMIGFNQSAMDTQVYSNTQLYGSIVYITPVYCQYSAAILTVAAMRQSWCPPSWKPNRRALRAVVSENTRKLAAAAKHSSTHF